MPLNLLYTMVQKGQKWPKTQIKGGSCLFAIVHLITVLQYFGKTHGLRVHNDIMTCMLYIFGHFTHLPQMRLKFLTPSTASSFLVPSHGVEDRVAGQGMQDR